MPRTSAGLLMFRRRDNGLEVFLVHPGGPFWKNKDDGAWTLPKGELDEGEEPLTAACREFQEETGLTPQPPFMPLGQVRQKGGKTVHAWAFEGDCDPTAIKSNMMKVQWPPGSGQWRNFPEIDRGSFFALDEAARKINAAQRALLDELQRVVAPP